MNTEREIIKALPGNGGYHVSNRGTVFCQRGSTKLAALKPFQKKGTRRRYVRVKMNGPRRNYSVAALVLIAHVGPPPSSDYTAAHSDGNAHNDDVSNLHWRPRTKMAGGADADTTAPRENERPIVGYASGYFVDPSGTVISYRRGTRKVLKRQVTHGYSSAQIKRIDGATQPVNVGVLVLTTHARPSQPGEVCRYRDGNKQNADITNVYWGTRHKGTQATQEATCGTLGTADGNHPATNEHRRACGPAEGEAVAFLAKAPPLTTALQGRSRGREIKQGRGQP